MYVKLSLSKYSSCRKVPGFLLLPTGLYLCMSHRDSCLQRQGWRVQGPWRRGWCWLWLTAQVVVCSTPGSSLLSWLPLHPPCLDGHPKDRGWSWQTGHPSPLRPHPHYQQGLRCLPGGEWSHFERTFHHWSRRHPEVSIILVIFCVWISTILSRQITMNDLPVGRSVDETLRLVQVWHFLKHIIPYEALHPSPRRLCTQTNMEKFVLLAGSLVLIPSFQIPRFLFNLLKKDVKC